MSNPQNSTRPLVPPIDSWRTTLQPQALADRLHSAVVAAIKIAVDAGYHIEQPSAAHPWFEIAQIPSEDWAQPRPVQEAIQLIEFANEFAPMLACDPPHPQIGLFERAFIAGELTARMPAWTGAATRNRRV